MKQFAFLKQSSRVSGYTLVELIVVMTIIVIFSSVAFSGYISYLSSARDSKRISDLATIKSALNGYSQKNNGVFPSVVTSSGIIYSGSISSPLAYQSFMTADFLSAIGISQNLQDPRSQNFYTYSVQNGNLAYQIAATLESSTSVSYYPFADKAYASSTCNGYSAYVLGNFIPSNLQTFPSLIYAFNPKTQSSLDISVSGNLQLAVTTSNLVNFPYSYDGSAYSCGSGGLNFSIGSATGSSLTLASCLSGSISYPNGSNFVTNFTGSVLNDQF